MRRRRNMQVLRRHRRWAWPSLAVAAALFVVAWHPGLAHTKAAHGPLWTDHLAATPAPAAVTAPNWAEIAKLEKPAVATAARSRIGLHHQRRRLCGDQQPRRRRGHRGAREAFGRS